ncbi:MAG: short-chain dehydrogenase [Acidobacteria bacterium]|nr:MAG: short-chain dehydrogenase [Acidobacteriota bacterium]
MSTFAGRVAVVTGAGTGIGQEIARRLALQGARVLLNDVDPGRAEAAAGRIAAEGGVCRAAGGDGAEVAVVRGLVEQAVQAFGRLDLAVANAGLTLYGDFFAYEPDAFDRLVAVNLRGSYFLAQAAARQMRAQGGGGRILLLSSVTGHRALKELSAYGMTKAALEMMARALVVELSPHGIAINAVAPGATVTPRTAADPEWEAGWARATPLGRPASVADVAAAALFLLSPEASHVTGQALIVDGGWTSLGAAPERA